MKEKDNTEYFLIVLNTDNMCENKDICELILGKYVNKKFVIYNLKVNNMVNIKFYFNLLLESAFSNSDFKEIDEIDLKEMLINNKEKIKHYIFKGNCKDLKQYIIENIGE